jgi:hypothetical protein
MSADGTSSRNPVGRPFGLQVALEDRSVAESFIERLADGNVDLESKIAELRAEELDSRVVRHYILSGETYSCVVCQHVRNIVAGSWRKHIKTQGHLLAEIAVLTGM